MYFNESSGVARASFEGYFNPLNPQWTDTSAPYTRTYKIQGTDIQAGNLDVTLKDGPSLSN